MLGVSRSSRCAHHPLPHSWATQFPIPSVIRHIPMCSRQIQCNIPARWYRQHYPAVKLKPLRALSIPGHNSSLSHGGALFLCHSATPYSQTADSDRRSTAAGHVDSQLIALHHPLHSNIVFPQRFHVAFTSISSVVQMPVVITSFLPQVVLLTAHRGVFSADSFRASLQADVLVCPLTRPHITCGLPAAGHIPTVLGCEREPRSLGYACPV